MNFKIIYSNVLLLIIPALLFFFGCSDDNQNEERVWQLVWEDNFDGPAGQSPDPAKWTFEVGTDWGNQQLEYNTDRPENVSLDGAGNLAITARRESYQGAQYTSGRISTRGLFDQAYGKFEARIQLPTGRGLWPAFWMLGTDCMPILRADGVCCAGNSGWPQCGEIDIMEYRGQEPTVIHGSLHGPGYSGGSPITRTYQLENDRFDTGFHTFAVEWGEDYIDYFCDGRLYQTITPEDTPGEWVFDQNFYLLLNVAIGGGFVGPPSAQTLFPQTMLVDWVKVYE